jgi:hypothetical protein
MVEVWVSRSLEDGSSMAIILVNATATDVPIAVLLFEDRFYY